MAKSRSTRKKESVWAVIVAGGASRRMGFDKLTADLEGRPVLAWSMAVFNHCASIHAILLVCSEGARRSLEAIARAAAPDKLRAVVTGGSHRHLSVVAGLDHVPPDATLVAVHDAARPFVTVGMIENCLEAARNGGAAACARPATETLKRVNDENFIVESVDRSKLWVMETPQIFRAPLLRQAYSGVMASGACVTDETSAVQDAGAPVALVASGGWNGKITFPEDLELARFIARGRAL